MNRYQHNVDVVGNERLGTGHYHLIVADDGRLSGAVRPGQFVNLRLNGRNELVLRRPFSVAVARPGEHRIEIVYRVVGKGTEAMTALKPGDRLDLLGPFGKGFHLPEGGMTCLLVGGGCGVAPLWGVAEALDRLGNRIIALLGFQSADVVFGEEVFRGLRAEVTVTTDDGSYGLKGFVSAHLAGLLERRIDRAYLCGPTPMFKAVLPLIRRAGIKGEVSLEERMGCGYGVCLSCVTDVRKGSAIEKERICTEGPVFDLEEVMLNP